MDEYSSRHRKAENHRFLAESENQAFGAIVPLEPVQSGDELDRQGNTPPAERRFSPRCGYTPELCSYGFGSS